MAKLFDRMEIKDVMSRICVIQMNTNMIGGPRTGEICLVYQRWLPSLCHIRQDYLAGHILRLVSADSKDDSQLRDKTYEAEIARSEKDLETVS